MTTGQLADLLLKHSINPGSNDVNDAEIREKALERTQETVDEIWDESDWDFKQKTTTLTLTATNDACDAPSDFVTFGEGGGLWLTVGSEQRELEYMTPSLLYAERERNRNSSGPPRFYTVSQQDDTFVTQICFDVGADVTYTLRAHYDSTPPLLLDKPLAVTSTLSNAGLGALTGAYSYRVVFRAIDGSFSEAGRISVSVTASSHDIVLTDIPTGNNSAEARLLYRTAANGSDYFLLYTFEDNVTTTLTDNFGDGSLTTAITATDTSSSLQRIPRNYHLSVVLKGALSRLARDFADGREQSFEAAYRQALGSMKSRRVHGIEDTPRIGEEGLSRLRMH